MKNTFDLKKFLVENKLTANSKMINEGVKLDDLFQGDKPNPNIVVVPSQSYKDEEEMRSFALRPSRKDGDSVIFSRIGRKEGGESRYAIEGDEVINIVPLEVAKKNLGSI